MKLVNHQQGVITDCNSGDNATIRRELGDSGAARNCCWPRSPAPRRAVDSGEYSCHATNHQDAPKSHHQAAHSFLCFLLSLDYLRLDSLCAA